MMAVIERYFHFHGVRGARLSRTQSVRGFDIKRSLLIRILSPILFCAPETHLVSLEKIWIDKTIKQVPWNSFLAKLERDWEQFILYVSTISCIDYAAFVDRGTGNCFAQCERIVPCGTDCDQQCQ